MTSLRRHVARGGLGLLAAALAASVVTTPASSAAQPGSAGVDTSLPATDSAVTVSGRGPFADLEVTVNQTEDLVNQAVSITWEGAEPTVETATRFAGNFLQIFQCWGDPDGTVPENPGPPPEQCVQGASAAVPEGVNNGLLQGFTQSRIISRSGWENFDASEGVVDARTSDLWRPFRAVDGTEVGIHTDPEFNPSIEGGNYWLNPYFNIVTTNEIPAAATGPDGRGAELFEVHTGIESSGLGCGQKVLAVPGGEPRTPECWLVVVPRRTAAEENLGTPFGGQGGAAEVMTSPVSDEAWQHRIAFPLRFNPVGTTCSLADDDRRIVGTELVLEAVASWQAALCGAGDLPPYSYANVGDDSARLQLANPVPGGPGMIVVSRPLTGPAASATDPVVYAPVSLSGLAVGFTVERVPRTDAPEAQQDLAGVRVAEMNLTPRLVAKLLTQSYRRQVEINGVPPYEWLDRNPSHLGDDPDFLRFNPEFELLRVPTAKNFAGLVLPAGNSDAARQVWEWVLADPEAKAWLDGTPDEWGMVVNPVYATTADANSNGFPFADPVPNSFPKSDPYCHQGGPTGATGDLVPPPLCGTDWLPYSGGFRDAARITRSGEDGAKTIENPFALSADRIWVRSTPTPLGTRAILSITDTASAARFGLQTAKLSRAGDDGDDRTFIAPDVAGLTAAVDGMAAGPGGVLEPDPDADAPDAYPLAALTYAAAKPLRLDAAARAEYAAFLDHVGGDGQQPGLELGQLPVGYAPLPPALRSQVADAAATLRDPSALAPGSDVPPPSGPPQAPVGPSGLPGGHPGPASSPSPVPSGSEIGSGGDVATPVQPQPSAPDGGATGRGDEGDERAVAAVTPAAARSGTRFVPPVIAVIAVLSGWLALEVTKRRRRDVVAARPSPPAPPSGAST